MTPIEFNDGAAIKALSNAGLNPHGTRVPVLQARQWWIDMLERVTDAVNEHDWNEEQYPAERAEEFVALAVEQSVAEARQEGRVLTLLELSDVDKVLTDPREGGVYRNLTSPLLVEVPGAGLYRHAGEDADEYDQRMGQARQQHCEASLDKLRLRSLTEVYLAAAATLVAEIWVQAEITEWEEANPEPEDDDEE